MANELITGLLKSPSQVKKEQQLDLMARAKQLYGSQAPVGGTTALPGIISQFGSQAAQQAYMGGDQAFRGLLGGAGAITSAMGAPETGAAISQGQFSPEERQARSAQQVLQNVDQSSPDELEQAAQELARMGLTGASQAIAQRAQTLKLNQAKIGAQEALQTQRETKTMADILQEQRTSQKAQRLATVNELKATVPFDPSNIVKYYTDQAQILAEAGFGEEADKAIQNAVNAKEDQGSSNTAAITNSEYYQSLSDEGRLNFQLANGRILDPETAKQLEAAKTEGRTTGKELATRILSFDERIATADQMLSVVQELPQMEGFESAVGLSARLPTLRPSTADFEVKLEQLKGQAFLEQFNKLRGAGAITEKEGTAAASALTALSSDRALQMSEEQFLKELETLKGVINKAKERANNGRIAPDWQPKDSYVPSPEETPPQRRRYNPTTQQFEDV